jgi:NAD(P)-dependent dehydrogenase (short-subunit alcohol dehydrogenase family)
MDAMSSPNQFSTLQDKVILITGATSGIGEATAQALAAKTATVVIVGRNLERTDSTVINIRRNSQNPNVDFLLADLSSIEEVRKLSNEFISRYGRLDVLINNAGGVFFKRQTSIDGLEMTFTLNHLSYFLLTNLLLEQLQATARMEGQARIINVASNAHYGARLDLDDLMFERRSYTIGGFPAYAQSKLANVLFTFELARRLEGSSVTANVLHPGFVATNLGKNNGRLGKLAMSVANKFAENPQTGAQTSIYLASWPEVRGVSGKYFEKCQPAIPDKQANDLELARRLWQISEAMTT